MMFLHPVLCVNTFSVISLRKEDFEIFRVVIKFRTVYLILKFEGIFIHEGGHRYGKR